MHYHAAIHLTAVQIGALFGIALVAAIILGLLAATIRDGRAARKASR